jgi:hypothetical protein
MYYFSVLQCIVQILKYCFLKAFVIFRMWQMNTEDLQTSLSWPSSFCSIIWFPSTIFRIQLSYSECGKRIPKFYQVCCRGPHLSVASFGFPVLSSEYSCHIQNVANEYRSFTKFVVVALIIFQVFLETNAVLN